MKINTRDKKSTDKYYIYGSKSHSNNKFTDWINTNFRDYELIQKGSSIKFCELAEGKADIYPRFGSTSERDTAAAQCIVEESVWKVIDEDLNPIKYNT